MKKSTKSEPGTDRPFPRVEVVAPVGKRAALRAAVCNGADAVYFGLGDFNARKRAENFKLEELGEVVAWLHRRNVKAYVTLNTLVFSDELEEVKKYIIAMAEAGVDAVIVQDLGVARLAKAVAPGLKIHASTQMSLTEAGGMELVRKELGIERVVLARELSIEEIKHVRAGTEAELEVFVHGAMCISYSGQCLGSLVMLGRSANRGVCGQPCRMVYDVVVNGNLKRTKGRYILSPRDLAAYEHVKELAEAGVAAMKIEGRMKNEYYVAAATAVYRQAADAAMLGKNADVSQEEQEALLQTFSRGFSSGFLKGKNHQELVHAQFGKNRGMLVGEVTGVEGDEVRVRVFAEYAGRGVLMAGNGVVFDDEQDEQGGRLYGVRESAGEAWLAFGREDIEPARVKKGALVWKTDDPKVKKRLEATWAKDEGYRREAVNVTVWAKKGRKLKIEMRDQRGNVVVVEGEKELEAAKTHAVTLDGIREQLGRMGGTPFELGELRGEAMEEVMVPMSMLNSVRREAVEKLSGKREARISNIEIRNNVQITMAQMLQTRSHGPDASEEKIAVVTRTMEQVEAVVAWNARGEQKRIWRVYGCFEDEEATMAFVNRVMGAGMSAGLATPRVIKPGEEWVLEEMLRCDADAVLVRNLAAAAYFRDKGIEMVADASLNAVNELTADVLRGCGMARVTFGRDAGAAEVRAMAASGEPWWYEAAVYGHAPMFHMEHCLMAANLSDGSDAKGCGRACVGQVELADLKGRRYAVGRERLCRNTVYAAGQWREKEYIRAIREAGVSNLRVELLNEGREEVSSILDFGLRILD
jgi:putative protease